MHKRNVDRKEIKRENSMEEANRKETIVKERYAKHE